MAENDFSPKRLSVWSREGRLLNAFYGPAQYGGGGELDPRDKSQFLYGGEGGGMLFKLDWKNGTNRLIDVYSRGEYNPAHLPQGAIGATQPQTTFYHAGRQYLTNVFNNSPTGGAGMGVLYTLEKGVAVPRAASGNAGSWPLLAWSLPGYNRYFYVRWSGQIVPRHSETYKFSALTDDGVRLWINNQKLINRWEEKGRSEESGTITLEAGKRYDIVMEFYQNQGGAMARLFWESPSQSREVVPSSQFFPTTQSTAPGGLTAEYHAGTVYGDLRGSTHSFKRVDTAIDFDWNKESPTALQPPETQGLRTRLPQNYKPGDNLLFVWSDTNGDASVQPNEVTFQNAGSGVGGVTLMPDLSFVIARHNGKAVRFMPTAFDKRGVPQYDVARPQILAEGAQAPVSSGGDQALYAPDGWAVLTNAPQPFSPFGIGGVKNGVPLWSYPSLWHGLHASHDAPMPEMPGQLIGTTRLLGGFVTPRQGEAGPLWAINGNKGNVYLFTSDGLFVATLFRDSRTAAFNAPQETRGMLMNDLSLQEENFWPTLSQTADGEIYLTGGSSSIMRLEGLEKIRRVPAQTLEVTVAQLEQAQQYFVQSEAARQQVKPLGALQVTLRKAPPVVDGQLNEWPVGVFATIRKGTTGAVAIAGERLYAAFKTDDTNLLRNAPESLPNLFKSGGALDLMLGNVEGGQRLLVTNVQGKTTAVLYRPRDSQATGEPFKFISNLGINKTTAIDRVENISDQVVLAQNGGNYEFSVPLALLRLDAQSGQSIKGDIGILQGNGVQTLQRIYWHNKATGLVSDLATEAELVPRLWGTWEFKAE